MVERIQTRMADRYRESGVDIEAADEAVDRIARLVESTAVPGVGGTFGGFGGVFDLAAGNVDSNSLLVSGTDGVGTKLKLAFMTGIHDTIGIDCVAMCVNDILTLGARPLFFLDYLAVGKLDPGAVESIVSGVAEGCRQAGCALIGGETAEMPGFYSPGEYDLAGFSVGAVQRDCVVDGSSIQPGNLVIGLPSTGFHSNGYSLLRNILLKEHRLDVDAPLEDTGRTVGETLLEPTRIYVRPVLDLLQTEVEVLGMVHITGGGLVGNLPRVLPDGLGITLRQDVLDEMMRPEFEVVQRLGKVTDEEMFEVFNMGVGFCLIVPPESVEKALMGLDGARVIGEVLLRDQIRDERIVDIPRCR